MHDDDLDTPLLVALGAVIVVALCAVALLVFLGWWVFRAAAILN